MENLQYGEILGEDRINSGFCWEIATGIYYANLGVRGSRWMGMRSRAPPVADAARRGTRSGRKERASEQREVLFGYRKAEGANTPWLPLERICAQYGFGFFAPEKSKSVSSTAKRQRGLQRGKLGSPLPCFASFCRSKRKAPAASGANYAFAKDSATPLGAHKLALNSHNKSQLHFPNKTHHLSNSHPVFPHFVNLP